jgi:hypothetical protein
MLTSYAIKLIKCSSNEIVNSLSVAGSGADRFCKWKIIQYVYFVRCSVRASAVSRCRPKGEIAKTRYLDANTRFDTAKTQKYTAKTRCEKYRIFAFSPCVFVFSPSQSVGRKWENAISMAQNAIFLASCSRDLISCFRDFVLSTAKAKARIHNVFISHVWYACFFMFLLKYEGTVLGPIIFLVHINDISNNISSNIKLFADDCVCNREILSENDCEIWQEDINKLGQWATTWGMRFQPVKCNMMTLTRKRKIISCDNTLQRTKLEFLQSTIY